MFDKIRLFAARALFAFVVAMSLGFGLLIAGMAAILGVLMIAAFRIAMIGAGRKAHDAPVDGEPNSRSEAGPAAQPA
ncbi:MAG: hypothetical protein BGP11_13035 [Rhodobacterales bacterium 65-51]|uniref:hypothetical protein n=1 Tax=uncultured Gemmobacter sp. TaxID=1095917 RepID=UPI00095F108A|nr:hypothetical protein [uncultured Gemmobacter sp.]OJY25813.1 MAG: hypothetical protein BGP11_13035 [Rhodobacterales bacterium 65-51]